VGPDTLCFLLYPFKLSFPVRKITSDFPWLFYNRNKQTKIFMSEAAVIYSSSGLADILVKKNVSSGSSFVVINKYHI